MGSSAVDQTGYCFYPQSLTSNIGSPYDIRTPQLADFERLGETLASEGDAFLFSLRTNFENWGACSMAQLRCRAPPADVLQTNASSLIPLHAPAIRSRARIISPEEWERYKPIIEDLYIDRGLTLKLVRQMMAGHHEFVATEVMYKKRFASWNWRKNYSREQKEEALWQMARETKAEDIFLNKKSLKPDRLRRPIQRNGHQIYLDQRNLRRREIIFRCQLQQSPENQRVELILRLAQDYWSSRIDVCFNPVLFRSFGKTRDFLHSLHLAGGLLRSEDGRAFAILNKAASAVRDALMEQKFGLLYQLLFEFADDTWVPFAETKFCMLRYFVSMARCTLGSKHPICELADYLLTERDDRELASRFSRLCIDVADNNVAHLDYEAAQDIKFNVSRFLISNNLYGGFDAWIQDLVQARSEQASLSDRMIDQMAILNLAFMKLQQSDVLAAEKICLQGMQAIQSFNEAHTSPDNMIVPLYSLQSFLGSIYRRLGDQEKSVRYLQMAIEGRLQNSEVIDPYLLDDVKELEDCLEENGKLEELKQLRDTWKPVWEELENELKG